MVPKEYILMHPEESFAIRSDPCVNVFELRKDGACVPFTAMDLSNNAGGSECARDLMPLLTNTSRCLTHFSLSSNNIGETGALFLAEALIKTTETNAPPLFRLELARNKMGDKGTSKIITALQESPVIRTLTFFDANGNDCGLESSEALGKYLCDSKCQLEHLDVGWNLLRNESAVKLFDGLASNATVKYLNLSWNGMVNESCVAIGECLKTCSLTELDLNHCNITGEGAMLLAPGLKKNKLLRKLILDHNNLKQSGARTLVKASLNSEGHLDEHGVSRIISMVDCNLHSVDSTTFNRCVCAVVCSPLMHITTSQGVPLNSTQQVRACREVPFRHARLV
jgi:Ran GTPase-activating protein (RanGAP) involved in mRNA processing and transport